MAFRSVADAVREAFIKQAFVPGEDMSAMTGGMPPQGMDPAMMGGMPPQGMDPAMMGGMPPQGMDPAMMGDPMAGIPLPPGADMGAPAPQAGMINMTADEFTKFLKQMLAAFGQGPAPAAQPAQQPAAPDISAKLDTLIAVLQGKGTQV